MAELPDMDMGETGSRWSDYRGLISSTSTTLPTVFPQLYAYGMGRPIWNYIRDGFTLDLKWLRDAPYMAVSLVLVIEGRN